MTLRERLRALLPGGNYVLSVTAPFAYVRWPGRPGQQTRRHLDPAAALRPWVPILQQLARQVYGYVRHQFSGYAPRDCETLRTLPGQTGGEC